VLALGAHAPGSSSGSSAPPVVGLAGLGLGLGAGSGEHVESEVAALHHDNQALRAQLDSYGQSTVIDLAERRRSSTRTE